MYWVISEMENGESGGWMKHLNMADAREDAEAQLEFYAISYIFPGDDDDPFADKDYLEKLTK